MKNKSLRSKIAMYAIAGAMAVSGATGAITPALAADTNNTEYTYSGSGKGFSSWRAKEDYTKVYVYPCVGNKIYYTVQSREDGYIDRSSACAVPIGVQASITNYVRENNGHYCRLKMEAITTSKTKTTGWWSPDSTKNYTIYY